MKINTSTSIPVIESRLNKAFHMLSTWCEENNMAVNLEKTASQYFP